MPATTRKTATATAYTAATLQTLEGLDAVRKRPAMYIGATDSRGLTHCVFELFDNAVDEALAGHCRHIDVTLGDRWWEVSDDGRGIPVDVEPVSGLSGVVLVMTKLHAGAKFGGDGYKVSGGLHGVGASVVNALSSRMDVTVRRDRRTWSLSFRRGEPGHFDGDRFQADASPRRGRAVKTTGTTVRFYPDWELFQPDVTVDVEAVRRRCEQTAFLVPGLTINLRSSDGEVEEFRHDGGLVDMVGAGPHQVGPLRFRGSESYQESVPVLEDGTLVTRELTRTVNVDVVVAWSDDEGSTLRSFCNVVETPGGGVHLSGAERAIVKAVTKAVASTSKGRDIAVIKDDVVDGLVLLVAVEVPEPQFEGQTKDALATPQVGSCVHRIVTDQFEQWLGERRSRSATKVLVDKVSEAARRRLAARHQRDLVKRKNALESASLPSKLKDCHTRQRERSELFVIEGDSAAGTVSQARDSDFQAYLPIRGKILNVQRVSERTMLDNAECAAIIQAIGAGSGRGFDVDKRRYSKLIILADADVDGSHIRTLLLTLVWRYMRPLLENGHVYAAVPPLYRITLKSDGRHVYCYSEQDKDQTLARLRAAKMAWRDDIQRYKGLGEMDAEQLADTTLDPATRRLRRLTVPDAEMAAQMFETLMGSTVDGRKQFIAQRAAGFDLGRLDV